MQTYVTVVLIRETAIRGTLQTLSYESSRADPILSSMKEPWLTKVEQGTARQLRQERQWSPVLMVLQEQKDIIHACVEIHKVQVFIRWVDNVKSRHTSLV